jgi:hypothetical protein
MRIFIFLGIISLGLMSCAKPIADFSVQSVKRKLPFHNDLKINLRKQRLMNGTLATAPLPQSNLPAILITIAEIIM